MIGAYLFWSFTTGYLGFTLSSAPAYVLTLVCMAGLGVLFELADLSPAPEHGAGGEAGGVPRSPAGAAGGSDRGLRRHDEVGALDPALAHADDLRPGRAGGPLLARRYRDRRRGGAGGPVPLDAVRPVHAGGVGERGLGHARRPLPEPPGGRQHGSRVRGRGRARRPGRPAGHARRADPGVRGRAGAGGRAAGRLHVVLHRLLRRARDGRNPVADRLLADAELVPDRRRRCAGPRRVRALRLPRDRRSRCSSAARASPAAARSSRSACRSSRGRSGSSGRARSPPPQAQSP